MAEREGIEERRLTAAQAYFRDEMRRAVAWRDRLDRTSNWAVVLTATLLTWSFSREENPHYVVLVAILTVSAFLVLEAHRYRRYDVWRSRLRLIERDLLAPLFDAEREAPARSWSLLASDLAEPAYKMPFVEALQRRLRRVHGPLLALLLLAWVLKVGAFVDGGSFLERALLGRIPGWAIATGVAVYTAALAALALWPLRRRAMEELDEDDQKDTDWQEGDG